MFSDLIIAFMPGERDAYVLRDALRAMRKQRILGVDRSVALSRDQVGGFRLNQTDEATIERVHSLTKLVAIAQWLFDQATPSQGDDLDEVFLAAVARAWRDNASALLFLVHRDGLSDMEELRRVLSLFQTRICETTLSIEAEARLSLTIGASQALVQPRREAVSGQRKLNKTLPILIKDEET